jgi:hypothetical protein
MITNEESFKQRIIKYTFEMLSSKMALVWVKYNVFVYLELNDNKRLVDTNKTTLFPKNYSQMNQTRTIEESYMQIIFKFTFKMPNSKMS